jgi:uncharacterized protein
MLDALQLSQAAARLARAASHPATVIVFGSYARGDAAASSDLDLLVIETELPDKADEYLRLKAALGRIGVGVDLLLISQSEFARRSQVPGTLAYRARTEGRVLHGPPH